MCSAPCDMSYAGASLEVDDSTASGKRPKARKGRHLGRFCLLFVKAKGGNSNPRINAGISILM